MARSPATNSSCHRRPTDCMASHIPVGLSVPPRDLTSATGARTTRFDRPHQCRSSRAPFSIAHEFDLALRPHAHTTSSRPPHPAPRFVTIGRNAPLNEAGCERGTIHQFLKNGSKIFLREGWTGIRGRRPSGKSAGFVAHEGGAPQRLFAFFILPRERSEWQEGGAKRRGAVLAFRHPIVISIAARSMSLGTPNRCAGRSEHASGNFNRASFLHPPRPSAR